MSRELYLCQVFLRVLPLTSMCMSAKSISIFRVVFGCTCNKLNRWILKIITFLFFHEINAKQEFFVEGRINLKIKSFFNLIDHCFDVNDFLVPVTCMMKQSVIENLSLEGTDTITIMLKFYSACKNLIVNR